MSPVIDADVSIFGKKESVNGHQVRDAASLRSPKTDCCLRNPTDGSRWLLIPTYAENAAFPSAIPPTAVGGRLILTYSENAAFSSANPTDCHRWDSPSSDRLPCLSGNSASQTAES